MRDPKFSDGAYSSYAHPSAPHHGTEARKSPAIAAGGDPSARYFNNTDPPNECPTRTTASSISLSMPSTTSRQGPYRGFVSASGISGAITSKSAPSEFSRYFANTPL